MSARKSWVYSPASFPKPRVPDATRRDVKERADEIAAEFKRRHVQPAPDEPRFNYLTDVYTRWHRSFLYFVMTYACPGPEAMAPSFEAPFTRLEYAGPDQFHLAYIRHTGKWWEVYRDLNLDEALSLICEQPFFHPP
jgi:hypothetical protein